MPSISVRRHIFRTCFSSVLLISSPSLQYSDQWYLSRTFKTWTKHLEQQPIGGPLSDVQYHNGQLTSSSQGATFWAKASKENDLDTQGIPATLHLIVPLMMYWVMKLSNSSFKLQWIMPHSSNQPFIPLPLNPWGQSPCLSPQSYFTFPSSPAVTDGWNVDGWRFIIPSKHLTWELCILWPRSVLHFSLEVETDDRECSQKYFLPCRSDFNVFKYPTLTNCITLCFTHETWALIAEFPLRKLCLNRLNKSIDWPVAGTVYDGWTIIQFSHFISLCHLSKTLAIRD